MERKTVLLMLLRKEDLGAPETQAVNALLSEAEGADSGDSDIVEGETLEGSAEPAYVFDDSAQAPAGDAGKPVAGREAAVVVNPPPVIPPLPTAAPVGTQAHANQRPPIAHGRPLTYEVAGAYMIGELRLDSMSIDELEMLLDDPKRATSIKNAIKVVKSRKVELAMAEDKEKEAAQ